MSHEAGIPLPSYQQLNNKIAYLRKTLEMHGDIVTSGELLEVINKHTQIPDDENEPFIKDHKIDILPCGKKARFCISITTNKLLQRLRENPLKVLHIDGTYKLIWIPEKGKEGWCVQVHGTSNLVNEFFPTGIVITSDETAKTYEEIFESLEVGIKFLMADGASSITKAKENVWKAFEENIKILDDGSKIDQERGMCYPHVQRNCQAKLKTIPEYEKEILEDIRAIQLSENREEFQESNTMFYVKWLSLGIEKIDQFIGYYHEQWVNSRESNWFVGAGPIDHNNGLEATNRDIKRTKVMRDKQKLGAFITNALEIVKGWSKKDDSRLLCNIAELVTLEEKTKGYQYMLRCGSIKSFRGTYYVLGEKAALNEDLKSVMKQYIQVKDTFAYEDGFDDWKEMKERIHELKDDGDFFKCSCPYGQKRYFYKHNIALSIKLKNYAIPDVAKSVPLQEKRRRGRPTKNKGWWSKE